MTAARYHARLVTPDEIASRLRSDWASLEARALYPNAFHSPHFVLPARKYLETSGDCFGVFVEREAGSSRELVGAAWLRMEKPTRRFPLPHLSAFLSLHSYLADFLLDREYAAEARLELYRALRRAGRAWHGLRLNSVSAESIQDEAAQAAARENGMRWHPREVWQRATFQPIQAETTLSNYISKRRMKTYRNNWKKLTERGRLDWGLRWGGVEGFARGIEDFLRAEHSGWKKEQGTSLLSRPREAAFFREMMSGFGNEKRAFLTEIRLDDRVIASSANLISGQAGFGFKIGWEETFAEYGIGIANEIQLIEHAAQLPPITQMDSCAAPDSYMNELWPGRRALCDGWFSLTPLGEAALNAAQVARTLKARLRPRNGGNPSA